MKGWVCDRCGSYLPGQPHHQRCDFRPQVRTGECEAWLEGGPRDDDVIALDKPLPFLSVPVMGRVFWSIDGSPPDGPTSQVAVYLRGSEIRPGVFLYNYNYID